MPANVATRAFAPTAQTWRPNTVRASTTSIAAVATTSTRAGSGMPSAVAPPSAANAGLSTARVPESARKSADERKIESVPSVAMKGGSRPATIASALTALPSSAATIATVAPTRMPAASGESPRIAATGAENDCIASAAETPARAKSEPTERSMPPPTITNVMPSAMRPL